MTTFVEDAKIIKEATFKKTENAYKDVKFKARKFGQSEVGQILKQMGSAILTITEVLVIIYASVLVARIASNTVDAIVPPKP